MRDVSFCSHGSIHLHISASRLHGVVRKGNGDTSEDKAGVPICSKTTLGPDAIDDPKSPQEPPG